MTANVKNTNISILAKDSDQLVEIMNNIGIGPNDIDKVRVCKDKKTDGKRRKR